MSLRETVTEGIRVLRDDDAADAGFLVAFSDRHGGTSRAPYDSLNLGGRVGDDVTSVESNRERVAHAAGYDPAALALARQVHGVTVLEVGAGSSGVVGEADVLVTSVPGVVLGILTADCAPVVVAGDDTIGLVHAGWRGLVAGVLDVGVRAVPGVRRAWIGPCIHSCCYEVGPEVVAAFESAGLPIAAADRVDPRRAAEHALARAGVNDVVTIDVCTSCDPRYFSYRRDGVTGRQGAFAALVA
jgi:YfiH family protein